MEPDLGQKLEEWRAKALAGTLSMEEMREAIKALRQGRERSTTAAKAKASSKKVINSEDLLAELL